MSNDHSDGHGNSSNGSNRDDVLNGSGRDDRIDGRNGDDQIFGNGGNDLLRGGKGDDVLSGGAGNDILFGNSGKDVLLGGAGNDILYGDDKGHGHFSFWWLCKPPGYADYLDGGSGNDKVYGAGGNDFANYTMAENLGAHDVYDGGKGADTLQLKLTYGEFALASVQKDIAHYQAFLTSHANPLKDNGATFQFTSFDLDAADFETLKIELVNTGPTAKNDTGATNEDTVRTVAKAAGLLANDTDPDHLDVLHVSAFAAISALGAAVNVNADGSYSYDPTGAHALQALAQGASATDTFTYTIADLAGATSTATVSIKVTGVNDAPVALNDAYSVSEDSTLTVPGSGVLGNDSDIDSAALTALLVNGPAHGTLTLSPNGSFIYTPGADFNGSDAFSYRAHDGIAGSGPALVSINVTAVNDAPTAVNDGTTLNEDSVAVIAVLANDNTGPANESAQTLAVIGAAAQHGNVGINADGTLGYTPNTDYFGDDTITYTIQDNGTTNGAADPKTAVGQIAVTVNAVNDAPTAVNDSAMLNEDSVAVIAVLANDNTGPANESAQTLTLLGAEAQHGNVLINADGTLGYTPNADYFGDDTITYTIQDNGTTNGVADPKTAVGQVAVTVSAVNDAPTAVNDTAVLDEDSVAIIAVLANDSTGPANEAAQTLAVTGAAALHGNVAINADGTLDYTPNVDYFGADTITYTIQDNGTTGGAADPKTAIGQVGITVREVNDAPTAADDTATLDEDSVATIAVLGNDSAGPASEAGQALTVLSASALHGGVTINADGTLSYAPTANYNGADTISYTIRDNGTTGGAADPKTASASVAVTVNPVNDAPVGASYNTSTNEDTPITFFALINDTDADGDTLAVTSAGTFTTTLGAAVVLNADGRFTYDPTVSSTLQALDSGESATDGFFYTVGDGHGGTGTAHVGIVVNGVTDASNASGQILESIPPSADLDYYVRIDGGDWLHLDSFATGFANSGSIGGSGTGGGSGKASASDIVLGLGSSEALIDLTTDMVKGTHLADLEVEAYSHSLFDGKAMLVDEFKFTTLLVTKLDAGGASDGASSNAVSLDFGRFTHSHVEHDDQGAVTGTSGTGWDFTKNVAVSAPSSVTADAFKAADPVEPQPIKYYVHFDGANGWLELDSFSMDFSVASSGSAGGSAAGRPDAGPVNLLLGSSAEITALTSLLNSGKSLANIEIEAYGVDPDSSKQLSLIDEFKFKTALITAIDSDKVNANEVTFDFGSFTHGHVVFDGNGGVDHTTGAGWDFVKNVAVSAPDPIADGLKVQDESIPPSADLDYYVRIDGGDWLHLDSFATGFANSGSIGGSGTGGGSGKASASDIVLGLGSSEALIDLTTDMVKGTHLADLEVEAYSHSLFDGKAMLVDEFKFTTLLVTKLDAGGASDGASSNAVSLDFGRFTHSHVEHDDQGAVTGTSGTGWDFTKNVAVSAPSSVTADAFKAADPVEPQPIKYYVHFDGANGWLELDSFSMDFSVASSGSAGGSAAGRPDAGPVNLLLGSSAEITALTSLLNSGKSLANIEIEAYGVDPDSSKQLSLIDEFKFKTALITAIDSDKVNANEVTFDFGSFTHGHVVFDGNGGVDHTTGAGWDFVKNVAVSAPDPIADGLKVQDESIPPSADLDYYVRIDGGDWLHLDSFATGFANSGSIGGSGTGGGSGKASASDIVLGLGSSEALIDLTTDMVKGTHLADLEVEAYSHSLFDGKAMLVDEFKFTTLLVTKLDAGGASDGASSNAVSLDFGRFTHSHVEHDDQGAVTGTSGTGWDFTKNVAVSAPSSVTADAFKAADPTEPQPIKYYVHFDGANGWLELDSFSMDFSVASSGSAGGSAAGRPDAGPVNLLLGSSAEITALTSLLNSGKSLANIEIEAYGVDPDSSKQLSLIDEFKFKTALITAIDSDKVNANEVTFDFGSFTHGHVVFDGNGGVDHTTGAGWDFVKNVAVSAPTPHGDVDLFS